MPDRILDAVLAWALRLSSWIGWASLTLMMVLGTADVIGTFFFGRAIIGAFEMAESALAVVMFVGLVHVQASRGHIVVDLVTARLHGGLSRAADSLALLGTLVALYLITRQTWPLMLDSWRIREVASGSFGFPIYPVKTLVCLGATTATAVAAAQFLQSLKRLFAPGKGDAA